MAAAAVVCGRRLAAHAERQDVQYWSAWPWTVAARGYLYDAKGRRLVEFYARARRDTTVDAAAAVCARKRGTGVGSRRLSLGARATGVGSRSHFTWAAGPRHRTCSRKKKKPLSLGRLRAARAFPSPACHSLRPSPPPRVSHAAGGRLGEEMTTTPETSREPCPDRILDDVGGLRFRNGRRRRLPLPLCQGPLQLNGHRLAGRRGRHVRAHARASRRRQLRRLGWRGLFFSFD